MEYRQTLRRCLLAALMLGSTALATAFGMRGPDGWSEADLGLLASLRLAALPPAPTDPSNAYEASAAAARLGQHIFFDRRFSGNGNVACASCHRPERQFQDGRALAQGMAEGMRRTMPVVGAGYSPFLFWDGRKDSLWSQALGPLEARAEHGGSRLAYAHLLAAYYRSEYEAVFGQLPDLRGMPQQGGPFGSAPQQVAWAALPLAQREQVSRVFANLGKAIAAYEKTLQFAPSRMDRYIEATLRRAPQATQLLTAAEKNGLRLFIGKAQCITCHGGPLLTDQHFHNTGIAPRLGESAAPGRQAAIAAVQGDEFNCLGQFSDARPAQCAELQFMATDDPGMLGAFKTPSLRNVALRAPYMYAGQLASIDEVIQHYAKAPAATLGRSELKPFSLTEQEARDLAAFLGTL
jgi:cytochrome c peroxidase